MLSFPYAVSGYRVACLVADVNIDGGILICGTGVRISLAANKVKDIRICVCSYPFTARLSKQHNNTNILAFVTRIVGSVLAIMMTVEEWLNAEFKGGLKKQYYVLFRGLAYKSFCLNRS